MKKPATLKLRNHVSRVLWENPAFHMRAGPDKRRKQQAKRPTKHQLRNATHV